MHIVKSVGVLSVAKIMGMIYACMGLLFVPLILLMSVVGSMAGQDKSPFAGMIGIGFAVVAPVFYGVVGFIAGAIGAFLYNLFAGWVGGFQLELETRLAFTAAAPYPLIPPATPGL